MKANNDYFDSKICHLTFSHNDCCDIWPVYFGEMKKYFKVKMDHYLCTNLKSDKIPVYIKPIYYDDSHKYPARLKSCLLKLKYLKYEYVFFDHEDMFLYDYPNIQLLTDYYRYMKDEDLDHIRLIKGGRCKSKPVDTVPSLHLFDVEKSSWIFSIQPSFWKIDSFLKVLDLNIDVNIWDLERKSQKAVKELLLKAAYSYAGGKRRGLFHFDNNVYPYVSTAIGKGKWNYSEFKSELNKVFKLYGIDPSIRGKNSFLHR